MNVQNNKNITWFSAINKEADWLYSKYIRMYRVAVLTAIKTNPNIKPFLILDGEIDNNLIELEKIGVTIIKHTCTFYDELKSHYINDPICSGAFLRIDIPLICDINNIDDEYVLYTDNDVMFMGDISELIDLKPIYFLAAGETTKNLPSYNYMNSGVTWMNIKNMRKVYDEFVSFIKCNLNEFVGYDQGAAKLFFKDKIEELHHSFNYKPYWGESNDIKIIHFHGPKPIDIMNWPVIPDENSIYKFMYTDFFYKMRDYFLLIEKENI